MKRLHVLALLPIVSLFACAAPTTESEAPTDDVDSLAPLATITSVNADGSWTATALPTTGNKDDNYATATFTGPAGKTRKMGVCLLKKYPSTATCESDADCVNRPTTLPSGGARYCTAAEGSVAKYCYYRGSETTSCAGSPALGAIPVPPGTYSSPSTATGFGKFISYACFEGCKPSKDPSTPQPGPSVTSAELAAQQMCGGYPC